MYDHIYLIDIVSVICFRDPDLISTALLCSVASLKRLTYSMSPRLSTSATMMERSTHFAIEASQTFGQLSGWTCNFRLEYVN